MATLERSTKSFRRQGSSGLVWDYDEYLIDNMSQTPVDCRELRHCQSTGVCPSGKMKKGGRTKEVPSVFGRSLSTPASNLQTLKAFGSKILGATEKEWVPKKSK
ncbi:hypothetical protein NMG60_11000917 [Bertholletia excelsa]